MCLLSPKRIPKLDEDSSENEPSSKIGNLFTLFLSDPLGAFCYVFNKRNISAELYENANKKKNEVLTAILQLIQSQSGMDPAFSLLVQEEFLRRFIVHYVFCMGTLMYHKKFQHPKVCKTLFYSMLHEFNGFFFIRQNTGPKYIQNYQVNCFTIEFYSLKYMILLMYSLWMML